MLLRRIHLFLCRIKRILVVTHELVRARLRHPEYRRSLRYIISFMYQHGIYLYRGIKIRIHRGIGPCLKCPLTRRDEASQRSRGRHLRSESSGIFHLKCHISHYSSAVENLIHIADRRYCAPYLFSACRQCDDSPASRRDIRSLHSQKRYLYPHQLLIVYICQGCASGELISAFDMELFYISRACRLVCPVPVFGLRVLVLLLRILV